MRLFIEMLKAYDGNKRINDRRGDRERRRIFLI